MKRFDAICYDLEIARAIPDRGRAREPDIDYCEGWGDKAGMGVSVLAAMDLRDGRTHVYLEDNIAEFAWLAQQVEQVVGFNSEAFDDKVLYESYGSGVATTYDLKKEVFAAAGSPEARLSGTARAKGRTLDALVAVNFPDLNLAKEIEGYMAPILWQRGERGRVIDYCIGDVFRLAKLVMKLPSLVDPVTGQTLTLRPLVAAGRQEMLL